MSTKNFRCTSNVPRKLAKASYSLLAICSLTLVFDLLSIRLFWGNSLLFTIAVLVAVICLIVIFIFGKCVDDYQIIVSEGVICVFLINYGFCETFIISECHVWREKKNFILSDGTKDWLFDIGDTDDETGVDIFYFLTVALEENCFNIKNVSNDLLQLLEAVEASLNEAESAP